MIKKCPEPIATCFLAVDEQLHLFGMHYVQLVDSFYFVLKHQLARGAQIFPTVLFHIIASLLSQKIWTKCLYAALSAVLRTPDHKNLRCQALPWQDADACVLLVELIYSLTQEIRTVKLDWQLLVLTEEQATLTKKKHWICQKRTKARKNN